MPDATPITNLLFTYAERFDAGDFAGAAALFQRGRVKAGPTTYLTSEQVLAMWEGMVRRYPDGTPRTRHVTTNVIVEFADDGESATTRSYYTVLQQTDQVPLQPVIAGQYHDQFARDPDGTWFWVERDYTSVGLVGDLSHHLLRPLGEH